MNTSATKSTPGQPRNLFCSAKATDFPKRYIHKSTILVTGDADIFGDPYYAWVTATSRRGAKLELRAYIGDENVRGFIFEDGEKMETRECFAREIVNSWPQTKVWLASLSKERFQVSDHSEEDLERLASVFRKLKPEWFNPPPTRQAPPSLSL